MRFIFTCLIFFIFCGYIIASQPIDTNNLPKFNIHLETGVIPIKSLNNKTQYTFQGLLAINYKIIPKIHLGLFAQTLLYTGNFEIANIDNKIIELSNIEYNSVGITLDYFFNLKKVILMAKIDLSYNFFLANGLDFPINKKDFLDYRYFTLTPKLNIGYKFSNSFIIGLNFGYNYQLLAIKGKKLEEFNPNSFQTGIFTMFSIK
jgi:hypothetical protein